jgi:hypothetical protein
MPRHVYAVHTAAHHRACQETHTPHSAFHPTPLTLLLLLLLLLLCLATLAVQQPFWRAEEPHIAAWWGCHSCWDSCWQAVCLALW